MVKPFLSLMIVLFLSGGGLLTAIYMNWYTERCVRFWESLRLRGYEHFYRLQFKDARDFFERSQGFAATLGRNNFRYALSNADLAKLYAKQGDYDRARKYLGKAISIFQRQTPFDLAHFPLHEDQILLDCQLVELDLKSGKGSKKAWQDCQRGLDIYFKQKPGKVDPTVSRTLCQTLAAIGDAAAEAQDSEVLQNTCKTSSKIAELNPNLKGLTLLNQKHMQCPFSAEAEKSIEDLLSTAESEMKARHNKEAREALSKAQTLAGSSNDSLMRIEYLLGRVEFVEGKLEDAEKHFLSVLKNPAMKDDKTKDEMLLRLSQMYRHCGYPESVIPVFKAELEARKNMYGAETSKVCEIETELARVLHEQGQIDEGRKYLDHVVAHSNESKKDGAGNLGLSSVKLAAVLLEYGDLKLSRSILESIIQQYEQGMKKQPLWIVIVCYNLAVINELEGNHTDCQRFLSQAQSFQSDLDLKEKFHLVESNLKQCCFLLKDKPIAATFIKASIANLPLPADRHEALRELSTIESIQTLKKLHPSAFTPAVESQIRKLMQSINKYPRAKLTGWH